MSRQSTPEVMPILSAGRHRNPRRGACFMEFASYLAGERWSDHPSCTHATLSALARDVNDLTSDSGRAALVPHIHRVVGLTSDDARIEARLAVIAACAALPVASMERQRALAVALLTALPAAGDATLDSLAERAFAQAPDTRRWAEGYLSAHHARPFDARSAVAIIHTSTVGIAQACIRDADARLTALLESAIDYLELAVRPAVEGRELRSGVVPDLVH